MFIIKRLSLVMISCSVLATGFISCAEEDPTATDTSVDAPAEEKKSSTEVAIGQTLKTEYFDVTVGSAKASKSVRIDEIQNLEQEAGNKYLVFDVTLKNTDSESRMMFDGEVIIKANGKEYKYEVPEPVFSDGWGMIMDNINPLVTKKTKLVYKIPDELKGTAYYHPARSDDDQVINLGPIN